MKNPASFLKFTALSLSVCLLAQYLCAGAEAEFFKIISANENSGKVMEAALSGFFQLSHLVYGIFLYNRSFLASGASSQTRFPTLYFSYFSLALSFIAYVLAFADRFILAAFWSATLIFFLSVLFFSLPRLKFAVFLLGLPQLLYAVLLLILSVLGIIIL